MYDGKENKQGLDSRFSFVPMYPQPDALTTSSATHVLLLALCSLILLGLLAGCDGNDPNSITKSDPPPPTGPDTVVAALAIEASAIYLPHPGLEATFSATATNAAGDELEAVFQWVSSDPAVATIAADGTVTGHQTGTAVISVEAAPARAEQAIEIGNEPLLQSDARVIAFVGVQVIPMDQERILTDQTVIVRDGLIAEIGPVAGVSVPTEAEIIQSNGETWYLMPGLADMHVHFNDSASEIKNDHILFLANGVTTVRDMWGSTRSLIERGNIRERIILGPTIYSASPGMDGPGGPWPTAKIITREQARSTVAQHTANGFDFIKVYNQLSPDVYNAIVDEAANQGIAVIGHVPNTIDLDHTSTSGQRSHEHLIGFILAATPNRSFWGTLDRNRVEEVIGRMQQQTTWFTPTLAVSNMSASRVTATQATAAYRYIAPSMKVRFATGFFQGYNPLNTPIMKSNLAFITKALVDADVPIMTGTDAGFGYVLQGFSIDDELNLLGQAGLTPYQALVAATQSPGGFIAATVPTSPPFGTITAGSRADLLLLTANPLDNVSHVQQRLGVMAQGRWRSATWFENRLESIARSYGN